MSMVSAGCSIRCSRLRRAFLPSVAVMILLPLLHPPGASSTEGLRGISPVAVDWVPPLPEDQVSEDIPMTPVETPLPEHRAIDEETWRLMKEWARFNPNAAPPDAIVPVVGRKAAAPLLPGQTFGEGGGLIPPDVTLARGETRMLQAVNSSIALYNGTGALIERRSLVSFFGAPVPSANVLLPPFDPKVLFDRNATNRRFFVVATQHQMNPYSSTLWLAVSRSPNPANLAASNWCRYAISTTDDFGTPLATFADQPNIGVGADSFVISGDHFGIPNGPYTFVVIRAFNKISLENNAGTCPIAVGNVFRPSDFVGDLSIKSLQPVVHYNSPTSFSGANNPVYLVNPLQPPSAVYRVWRIKDPAGAAVPGQLQWIDVAGSFTFDTPPDAPQSGTGDLVEVGDTRVWGAQGLDNTIWAAHSTVCNNSGGPTEACARVVSLNVGQNGAGSPTASISQQTTFGGGANVFYWMPSVAVRNNQRTAIIFLRSSTNIFLSSAWAVKDAGASSYGIAQTLGTGSCLRPLQGGQPSRTGDYLGVHTAPDLASFWLSAEHAAIDPPGSGLCSWKTEILQAN